jgi:Ca2+-binding RTX toxin-like protein
MSITVTGQVPATIFENDRPEDWLARLPLSAAVLEAALTGADAQRFSASLAPGRREVLVRPAERLDAEALGADRVLQFGLMLRTAAGWQTPAGSWQVTLLGLDDTPPQGLRFFNGGTVLANDMGGEIGLLTADDPDSAGPLTYEVAWPDAAWFEVQGSTLRLRQGVDLLAAAGTTIEITIEVSDGRNTAAMLLAIAVLTPGPLPSRTLQDGTLGADTLTGGAGADALYGHAGTDTLLGADGNDELDGGTGNDSLDGGAGNDSMRGAAGNDRLQGNIGNDTMDGGADADSLSGANGNDLLDGAEGADTLRGGNQADTLRGGADNDLLDGGNQADSLDGGEGDDQLLGGADADTLSGGAGADTLDGGTGTNLLFGGPGDDTYLLALPGDHFFEAPGEGMDELVIGWSLTMPADIERLRLRTGSGDLALTGAAGADTLIGNDGSNLLLGEAGDDQLEGGAAADTLRGGDGLDRLLGEDGDDRLEGEAGADLLGGGPGNDTLLAGPGDDRGFGGDGADTLDGAAGHDSLQGGAGADSLTGGAGNDLLDGGDADDRLEGGSGADTLIGAAGNDLLRAGSLAEAGQPAGAVELLRGGAGADTLDAAAGDGAASLLIGELGDDLYLVDSALDQVFELADGGADTLQASLVSGQITLPAWVEALVLLGSGGGGVGNALDNRISGNAGANLLFGSAGADTLIGGLGADTLIGGAGADVFVIAADGSTDLLMDYTAAEDRILAVSAAGFAWVSDPAGATGLLLLPAVAPGPLLPAGAPEPDGTLIFG